MNDKTHFGYQTVDAEEKKNLVGAIFDSVAARYDVMNDVMSFGIHRQWKRFALGQTGLRYGNSALDLAAGTGDLAAVMSRRVGDSGDVVLADINQSMLTVGRDRMLDRGLVGNLHYTLADAEALPFERNSFDCVTMAFGLRNVTDKQRALESIFSTLKPGGRLLVLEFSKPVLPLLSKAYDAYSFTALPLLGKLIASDGDSYRYLAESIRRHPDQQTLLEMMQTAGFERCSFNNLTGGIVALHKGFRL